MTTKNKITRRQFLIGLITATAGLLGLEGVRRWFVNQNTTDASVLLTQTVPTSLVQTQSMPTIISTSTSTKIPDIAPTQVIVSSPTATVTTNAGSLRSQSIGRVIHIHSNSVTDWQSGADPAYWNHVNQNIVNTMVDRGVMELTKTGTATDAWRTLLATYQPGQKIAIKVSFNNQINQRCNSILSAIDSVIEPVNAVVRRLIEINVLPADIWVYDAMRTIPDRFALKGISGIQYFDRGGGCRNSVSFTSTRIAFEPTPGLPMLPAERLPDILVNATYLINMPIMKHHACGGVSLAFKNHFGTIDNPGGLHPFIFLTSLQCSDVGKFDSKYSPLVDIYKSPHIGGKTMLTIGDGLFAALGAEDVSPTTWKTFNNQVPRSLFFATDPVAIDSVMADLLRFEKGIPIGSTNYLTLAANAGLGLYEQGNPTSANGTGYSQIYYRRFEV